MFKNRSGIMNVSLEDIDGVVEAVEATDTGVDEAAVIEATEGAEEQADVDTQVTEITTAIEDALGVVDGAEEIVAQNETALASAEEVTADVVQASQESLAQARAIMGMDKSSNIGFEAIVANPRQALKLSNEDWKETAKLIYEKAKEFFRGLLALMKKGYVAIMKMTAADMSTVDAMIKKVKASATLEASTKDGTIFKSTTTKVRNKLGAALALVGQNDLKGANFAKGLDAIINLVNDKKVITSVVDGFTKNLTAGSFGTVAGTEKVSLSGVMAFESLGGNLKSNFTGVEKADIAPSGILGVKFGGTKIKVLNHKTDSYSFVAKEAFINSISVEGVTKENLLAVLNTLKGALTKNKEFFEAGEKSVEAVEKAFDAFMKGSEKTGKENLALKVATRISRGVVYDSILNKISTDRAILSAVSTIAHGKADKEEEK